MYNPTCGLASIQCENGQFSAEIYRIKNTMTRCCEFEPVSYPIAAQSCKNKGSRLIRKSSRTQTRKKNGMAIDNDIKNDTSSTGNKTNLCNVYKNHCKQNCK